MIDTIPVRRRVVGGALRRYRENVGFGLDDAARVLECDRSKISRIEACSVLSGRKSCSTGSPR
jgi:hypothetical protein